jgi:hypothetical protein
MDAKGFARRPAESARAHSFVSLGVRVAARVDARVHASTAQAWAGG